MAIAVASLRAWRWPLLMFLTAILVALTFAVDRTRRGGDDPATGAVEAPAEHSGNRAIASAAGTVIGPTSAGVALQQAGPPDPVAQKAAADSAARAADTAAALAASAPGPGN